MKLKQGYQCAICTYIRIIIDAMNSEQTHRSVCKSWYCVCMEMFSRAWRLYLNYLSRVSRLQPATRLSFGRGRASSASGVTCKHADYILQLPPHNHHQRLIFVPASASSASHHPHLEKPLHTFAMDALVAQYSAPAHKDEGYQEQEQLELVDVLPSLSLKFALPPVAQASSFT